VLSSLKLQRLKLFHLISGKKEEHSITLCCSSDFVDDELEVLDQVLLEASVVSEEESASLFYIAGYVTKKCGLPSDESIDPSIIAQSEFQSLLDRGRLSVPAPNLLHFTHCAYFVFQRCSTLSNFHKCAFRMKRMFVLLYHSLPFTFSDIDGVCRRLSNTFFKGFGRRENQQIPIPNSAERERRKRKLTVA
jgi:hypothetical protein